MYIYSIIMFAVAALIFIISIAIYRGNTNLIHSYHQEKVTDKTSYGKAFGKAMTVFSLSPLSAGIIGLCNRPLLSVGVFAGIAAVGIICIIAVQIKYNKGIF